MTMYNTRSLSICEHCAYTAEGINNNSYLFYEWDELIAHMRGRHWVRVGTREGQPLFACTNAGTERNCASVIQFSYEPVVDFTGNLYCGMSCAGAAYRDRLKTHDMIAVLSQEKRDEQYVLQSLGIKEI